MQHFLKLKFPSNRSEKYKLLGEKKEEKAKKRIDNHRIIIDRLKDDVLRKTDLRAVDRPIDDELRDLLIGYRRSSLPSPLIIDPSSTLQLAFGSLSPVLTSHHLSAKG